MLVEQLTQKLRSTPLFGSISDQLLTPVLQDSPLQTAHPGDQIVEPGGHGDKYIVVVEGEIEARHAARSGEGHAQDQTWTVRATTGDGGVGILSVTPTGLAAQALTDVQYLCIDADRVDELLAWTQFAEEKGHNEKLDRWMGLLRRIGIFRHLPLENVQRAFECMESRSVAAGETVVNEGDKGEEYFLIEAGQAEVIRTDPFTGETAVVDHMEAGEGFGEESLLQQGFRNATIRMLTPGRFLVLKKEDFDELVKPAMLVEISAPDAHALVQQGAARLLDCRYDMEYEESRIPGAELIQLHKLRFETDKLDPGTRYVVYCRSGRRSKAAAFLLTERKFQAQSLIGGIKDWPYDIDDTPVTLP